MQTEDSGPEYQCKKYVRIHHLMQIHLFLSNASINSHLTVIVSSKAKVLHKSSTRSYNEAPKYALVTYGFQL